MTADRYICTSQFDLRFVRSDSKVASVQGKIRETTSEVWSQSVDVVLSVGALDRGRSGACSELVKESYRYA